MKAGASRGLAFVLLLVLALVAVLARAEPLVDQPRSFGHVIGDVLVQRLLLQVDGHDVTPRALPPADRVGLWLERRTPRIERDAEGRPWLRIEHQVINAPRSLTEASLPALQLATTDGETLALPAWPIRIGPITPAESLGADEAAALRPDRHVSAGDAAPIQRRQQVALALLAGVLLAWAGWWAGRNWIEARRLPFAAAWRQLRRLDEADPQAWRALHHALNASAGQLVQAGKLGRLLAERPALQALQPLQADLEAFFRASETRFFAVVADDVVDLADDAPTPAFPLKRLARALQQAERRGAR